MTFPIFQKHKGLVYLDSAATTQKPKEVIDAVATFMSEDNATVNRALYPLALEASNKFEDARQGVADFIGAKKEEIIFTKGATESLNALAYMLAPYVEKDSLIVLSEMEHHANIIPWQQLAAYTGAKIVYIPLKGYELDYDVAKKLISKKTAIVSLTHMSNVLGTVNNVKMICDLAKKVNAITVVDGAQSVAHVPIDVQELGCDFFCFSGHKVYGPTGVGVLFGKTKLLKELEPYQTGGNMIDVVTKKDATWASIPQRFEAGTTAIAQVVGLGAAIAFLRKNHKSSFELTQYARKKMEQVGATVLAPKNSHGILSFTIPGIHPHDIADELGQNGMCVRAGHHCAMLLHKALGLNASTRVSFGLYNSKKDVDKLARGLIKIREDYS